jgi:hypothetical protein
MDSLPGRRFPSRHSSGASTRPGRARLAWTLLAALALADASPPVATAGGAPAEAGPREILVIPGSHLDVGFTAPPSDVRRKRVATLDAAIEAAEKDPEFRWTEECGWSVHAWLDEHGAEPERIARLAALVKARRIGLGACYVNPHAALFPGSLHHLFAFHEEVERTLGVRPKVAIVNDVPSLPEEFVDAAAKAGVEMLICGANLAFSPPIPVEFTRVPFRWRTAAPRELLVAIDPDSYTAAYTKWGIDPDTARFMAKDRFGALEGLAVARSGIAAMSAGRRGTVVVQHAFDNWGIEAALRLPAFVRAWNAEGGIRIRLGVPDDALDAWRNETLRVRTGEWGGTWEEVRAGCPVTAARLAVAATETRDSAPLAVRLSIAAAMDHSGGLGPPWPRLLSPAQFWRHGQEWSRLVAEFGGLPPSPTSPLEFDPPSVRASDLPGVDFASWDPSLRLGHLSIAGEWFAKNAKSWTDDPVDLRTGPGICVLHARPDREVLPGDDVDTVAVGWDVPLDARIDDVEMRPRRESDGSRWLLGRAPTTVIAPRGVTIRMPKTSLHASSNLAFSYRLVDVDGRAHLQVLLLRQCRVCEFADGSRRVLPFSEVYPGEWRHPLATLTLRTVR